MIDLIPPGKAFDIGSELFPLLAERGLPFYAQTRPFNWLDIGTMSDYWEVLQTVLTGEVNHMDVPGSQIEPGIWTGLNTRPGSDTAATSAKARKSCAVCCLNILACCMM